MRPGPVHSSARCRNLVGVLLLAAPVLLAGCGSDDSPTAPPSPGSAAADAGDARTRLAGLAALWQDRSVNAFYTLSVPGQPERTVGVTRAADRSWRVDVPGAALGGTADVSVTQNSTGIYQCALPSATDYLDPVCVRIGEPGSVLPDAVDPEIQHAFTDWPEVLTDRQAPLAVSTAPALPDVPGTCFSVESTSASLNPPVDPGIYCYDPAGTLTGAKLGFGTLLLSGAPAAAPPTVTLPAPVVEREPLDVDKPGPAPANPTGAPTRSVG